MSRIRQEISSVQFQIDARKANASMDALQEKAKDLNKDIEKTQADIKALGDVAPDNKQLLEFQKTLRGLTRDLNDVTRAQNELIKGVKAADKLWKAAQEGNIESLGVKSIKAGQRGLQQRMQSLQPGDEADAKVLRAYKAVIEEADIVMLKFKTDAANTLKILDEGGSVSARTMRETRDNLKELVDITPKATAEYKEFKSQLEQMEARMSTLSENERRLAGEIVTVADAMKMANASTREAAEQRLKDAAAAKQQAETERATLETQREASRLKIETAEKEAASIKEQITEQEKLVKSQEALYEASDRADKEVDEARKKRDAARESTKQYTDAITTAANKVADLKKQLDELNATTAKPKVDVSELKKQLEKAKEETLYQKVRVDYNPGLYKGQASTMEDEMVRVRKLVDEYRKLVAAEKEAQQAKKEELLSEGQRKSGLKKAEFDFLKSEKGVLDFFAKIKSESSSVKQEFASVTAEIKALKVHGFDFDGLLDSKSVAEFQQRLENLVHLFKQLGEGPTMNGGATPPGFEKMKAWVEEQYTALSKLKESYLAANQKLHNTKGTSDAFLSIYDMDLKPDGSRNSVQLEYYERQLEAYDKYQAALKKELELQQQVTEAEQQGAQTTEQSVDADKKKAEVTKQLADAQAELDKATKDAEEPTKKLEKAEEDYYDALKRKIKAYDDLDAAREKQDFAGQNEKLDQLERQYDELTGSIEKEKQALNESATAAKAAYDKETEAAIEMAQAQNYSQKSLEDSIALLEKQSKVETDPKKYAEMTTAIETMQQRVKEMTGEWMSYAEAEKYAESIGTDGFIATSDQLQKATQSIQHHKDALIKSIQKRRESKNLTEEEKKALSEEETELKKVEAELKKMKFEMDNANMSSKRMHEILKDPKSAKNIEELSAAIKRSTQELKLMEETIGKDNAKYKEMAEQTKKATIEQKNMEAQFKASASAFEKAWSRLKTYVGLYVGAAVAMQKIVATMGDLMELSDKMGEVRKTTGFTADEVGRLSTALAKMDTRTTLTGLMELSAVAGQLGLKTEQDVRGFTEAANMLMVTLPEMGKEGATAMLKVALATGEIDKIRQQMQQGLVEGSDAVSVAMTKIGSTIDSLRANSAAAAPAITDFVKRVGAVGAQSGITIDQVAALGSTVDALGMRVEMSATALSRMIPAIKNNAFEIAKAIGVTPETIRGLFDAGRGMEAILMILQHIKDSGADEEGIEKMLGMGGMADIMKDLNQQGARAGIVFAGLSQNVDELRRQLGVARNAYADNIAIQAEYNKMNDTTAAKWERLKNKVEETFVGDGSQSSLGWIIDKMRQVVDLLTGDNGISAGIRSVILAITLLRVNIAGGLTGAVKTLYETIKKMSWVGWANLITSVGLAVWYLGEQLGWFGKKTNAASTAVGNLEKQLKEENTRLEQSFRALSKYTAELDKAKEKLEELTKAGKDTADAETELQKTQEKHDASIREINSKYGQYLGYMLSETASAVQLAKARELINAKLRETITLKQKEAALGDVEQEYGSGVRKAATKTNKLVQQYFGGNYDAAARVSVAISEAAEKYAKDSKRFNEALEKAIKAERKFLDPEQIAMIRSNAATGGVSLSDDDILKSISHNLTQRAQGLREAVDTYNEQVETTERIFDARANVQQKKTKQATIANLNAIKKDWEKALGDYQKASGDERAKLAVEVYKQQRAYATLYNNNKDYFDGDKQGGVIQRSIDRMKTYENGLRQIAKEGIKAVDAAERAESIIQGTDFASGGGGANNPWGGSHSADSTDWKNMTAEQLVTRRKQMKDFVNAIKTDTDVQSVLKEDAALKKAIEKGMSSDMRTVIEWYNTERLKIQDELHARHLTNTGDWMDPTSKKGRKKTLEAEWKYYLDELDAYYNERKAKIQQARNEEEITEAEAWRRNILVDAEWRKRRAELQQLYANKSVKVTQEEQDAIFDILSERTEDSTDYIQKDIAETVKFILKIGEKSKDEMEKIFGYLDKNTEQDFLKSAKSIGKQMKFIEDTLAKERPYDGITKNLQENLVKMGILTADLADEQRDAAEELKRTSFLLGEAENAYTLTVEEMMRRIADAGMKAWADELEKNPAMQQALMAQLRKTYDEIQAAIKKEATLIKKEVDIWWADIAPGADQSRKDTFERTLSRMGLLEDSVKRANQLIGAGQASERVADKLAIKQMQIRLAMQATYYNKMREVGLLRIKQLKDAGKLEDAEHLQKSLNLALTQEQVKLDEQRVAIANKLEESQNRLYTAMREYADLMYSSMQSVFEASNAGAEEFYNERAKLRLTGGTGETQQYIIIDNAGTSDATAHYETLNEMQAAERKFEIERQNAQAEAWKKVMDDINAKMNETITDQLNAMLQNASIDANTDALSTNTRAIIAMTETMGGKSSGSIPGMDIDTSIPTGSGESGGESGMPLPVEDGENAAFEAYKAKMDASAAAKDAILQDQKDIQQGEKKTDQVIAASSQSAFARMTQAANLYGAAYAAMSNDNLDMTQKFEMIALQAVGNAAISALTSSFAQSTGQVAAETPAVASKAWAQLGPIGGPIAIGVFTALIGGLMGLAASQIAKSKSQIAAATGSSNSVASGRLVTGMLTYAEGNVNEFTDPDSLTPGRQYNVDAADGRTYRARYMGRNPKTHITNGPEFHLAGERGREAIIDAHTTRQIQMDDSGIWAAIKTLSAGGSIHGYRSRRSGMRAFAEGNISEFSEYSDYSGVSGGSGMSAEQMLALQSSLDRNSEVLERAVTEGIKGIFNVYGKGGLVDSYDTGKKTAQRYGQRY